MERDDYYNKDLWEERYKQISISNDWGHPYASMRATFQDFLPADKEVGILDVGCGLSSLAIDLAKEGHKNVVATDFSTKAVETMTNELQTLELPNSPKFVVDNILETELLDKEKFGLIVDKFTLDCIYCMQDSETQVVKVLETYHKLLLDEGLVLIFTAAPVSERRQEVNLVGELFEMKEVIIKEANELDPIAKIQCYSLKKLVNKSDEKEKEQE